MPVRPAEYAPPWCRQSTANTEQIQMGVSWTYLDSPLDASVAAAADADDAADDLR